MKFLGSHIFKGSVEFNGDVEIYNADILNKLSIPLHKDISKPSFGDLYTENDVINFINSDGDINVVLDLSNDDLVKSLIMTELLFDDFYNYGSTYVTSNSLHDEIDIESDDFSQNTVSIDASCSLLSDELNAVNIIKIFNLENLSSTVSYINEFVASKLPLNIKLTDSTTGLTSINMTKILSVDTDATSLSLYFDIDSYTEWVSDATNCDIVRIDTFNFINESEEILYHELPPHKHLLKEISNIEEYTNVSGGFLRLTDTDLRLDIDNWSLWLEQGRVTNTVFKKKWSDQLESERIFIANCESTQNSSNVDYTVEEIIMADSTVYEYTPTAIDVELVDIIELKTKSGLVLANETTTLINDSTTYEDKKYVQILDFNYIDIFGSETDKTSVIELRYEWLTQTEIDNLKIYNTDYDNNVISVIVGYYEFTVVQPNTNTIPSLSVKYIDTYKDINNDVLLVKPDIISEITTDAKLSVSGAGVINVSLEDSTSNNTTIIVYIYNIITNELDVVFSGSAGTDITIQVTRGLYKFVTDNSIYNYTIQYLKG